MMQVIYYKDFVVEYDFYPGHSGTIEMPPEASDIDVRAVIVGEVDILDYLKDEVVEEIENYIFDEKQ